MLRIKVHFSNRQDTSTLGTLAHFRHSRHFIVCFATLCVTLIVFSVLSGCKSGENQGAGEKVLIRVGSSTLTVREFNEAFESDLTAPFLLYSNAEELRDEKYRTLNRLTEELVILERARELDLQISDGELQTAVDDFKKDFPDDTFEQTLIENGVSYLTWEKGLKRRLLMEKVIRKEVSPNSFQVPLAIDEQTDAEETPEDLSNDNDAAPNDGATTLADTAGEMSNALDSESETGADVSSERPVNTAESQYNVWIERLKQQYAIEIDWKLWEKIEQEDAANT